MKYRIFSILLFVLFISCAQTKNGVILVNDESELNTAITDAKAGDEIVLANGVWKDIQIRFIANGSEKQPIMLRAETEGQVFIEGESDLKFGGEYLIVKGLFFRNGFTPSNSVIDFKLNKTEVANNCTLTSCVILDYNQMNRDRKDHWVEFWGRNNSLENCYLSGKSNEGPTVRVEIKGNQNIRNHHRIVNNHFGPRPRKGGPKAESIQLGDSYTSMSPSNTYIANNLFERCNGEVEVISSKTNYNVFKNNVFYKCEGSLVTRHGNYCTIDGNVFIGDGQSENYGGIRLINTGHWVINNYFYKLRGKQFRSPLAIMNGIPKSPLNRYNQVTDVVVAYNTWFDCLSPIQVGVGTNISQKDVLPASEIRSATPIRTTLANNLLYNEHGDKEPIVAHDKIEGISFKSNYIDNNGQTYVMDEKLLTCEVNFNTIGENLAYPLFSSETEVFNGFDFETIETDLLGAAREKGLIPGAICIEPENAVDLLEPTKYGANWYLAKQEVESPKTLKVKVEFGALEKQLRSASNGDTLVLESGIHTITSPLKIDKNIVITSQQSSAKAEINFTGTEKSAAFEMHPYGDLHLLNIKLNGSGEQYAFASLEKNMSSLYQLHVQDCTISNFNTVLKAYKCTFADKIYLLNSKFSDCKNGLDLAAETNDKGDYNVEFLTIDNCNFKNIQKNVINYYRGGYDESTIGGNLILTNSTFSNCGIKEESKILLKTRGIINVDIQDNKFINNPVKLVALLWGAKNNNESGNTINNSGKFVTQENIKLKLVY